MFSIPKQKCVSEYRAGAFRLAASLLPQIFPIFSAARRGGVDDRPAHPRRSAGGVAMLLGTLMLSGGPVLGDDAELSDPMRPYQPPRGAQSAGPAPSPYTLTAVLVSPSRRVAIINGRTYRVGDRLDGARVSRIDARAVALERANRETVLRLPAPVAGLRNTAGDSSQ